MTSRLIPTFFLVLHRVAASKFSIETIFLSRLHRNIVSNMVQYVTFAELFRRARAKCFRFFLLSLPASALAVSCKLDVTLCRRYPGCGGGGEGGGGIILLLLVFPLKLRNRKSCKPGILQHSVIFH